MKKTKVTLALGAHGQVDWSAKPEPQYIGMNKDFFRKVASSFIEKIMKMKKRSLLGLKRDCFLGMIVFESVWPLVTYDPGRVNRHQIDEMDNTLNAGKPTNDPRMDWGFEDLVVRANSTGRNRLYCMSEMQTKEAMVKTAQLLAVAAQITNTLPQEEQIRLESKRLKLEMESGLLRDRTIIDMINHFRNICGVSHFLEHVLVVRGLAHKPMRVLFDESYDLRIKEDDYYQPWFYKEAVEKFYRESGLEDHEFEKLARLVVTYERLLEERNIALFDNAGHKKAAVDAREMCK